MEGMQLCYRGQLFELKVLSTVLYLPFKGNHPPPGRTPAVTSSLSFSQILLVGMYILYLLKEGSGKD